MILEITIYLCISLPVFVFVCFLAFVVACFLAFRCCFRLAPLFVYFVLLQLFLCECQLQTQQRCVLWLDIKLWLVAERHSPIQQACFLPAECNKLINHRVIRYKFKRRFMRTGTLNSYRESRKRPRAYKLATTLKIKVRQLKYAHWRFQTCVCWGAA